MVNQFFLIIGLFQKINLLDVRITN